MAKEINLLESDIFETGELTLNQDVEGQEWTIAATGDVRLQPEQLEALQSDNFPYQEVSEILKADIVICNLENPVIGNDELIEQAKEALPDGKQEELIAMPPMSLVDMQKMGINFANLANNHIKDFAAAGIGETIKHLDDYAMPWCGAGQDSIEASTFTTIEVGDFSIAVGGYTQNDGDEAGPNEPGANIIEPRRMLREVKALKEDSDIDFIVVNLHTGYEYSSVPRLEMFELAHQLVKVGADLILGTHPHVPHGFELYQGKPIFYSLGNFYYNMPEEMSGEFASLTKKSFVPKMTFRNATLVKLEIIPIVMTEELFIQRAEGDQYNDIMELLRYRSDQLNSTDIDLENREFIKKHVFDNIITEIYEAGARNDKDMLAHILTAHCRNETCLKCFKDISRLLSRPQAMI